MGFCGLQSYSRKIQRGLYDVQGTRLFGVENFFANPKTCKFVYNSKWNLGLKFIVIDSNDNEFYGKERSPVTELHHYMLPTEMCFKCFGNQFIIKYKLGKVTLCLYWVPQFSSMHGILFDYLITNGMCVSIYPFLLKSMLHFANRQTKWNLNTTQGAKKHVQVDEKLIINCQGLKTNFPKFRQTIMTCFV